MGSQCSLGLISSPWLLLVNTNTFFLKLLSLWVFIFILFISFSMSWFSLKYFSSLGNGRKPSVCDCLGSKYSTCWSHRYFNTLASSCQHPGRKSPPPRHQRNGPIYFPHHWWCGQKWKGYLPLHPLPPDFHSYQYFWNWIILQPFLPEGEKKEKKKKERGKKRKNQD